MIREIGDRVAVHHGGNGTEVSFEIAGPVPAAMGRPWSKEQASRSVRVNRGHHG
jgi:hypothetical protein